jgi:hypothetical protein
MKEVDEQPKRGGGAEANPPNERTRRRKDRNIPEAESTKPAT